MITYGKFLYQNSIRKIADLSKNFEFDEKFKFPFDSVVHLLDNMDSVSRNIDTFKINDYPFIQGYPKKVLLYHNRKIVVPYGKLPFSYNFLSNHLYQNLIEFNSINRRYLTNFTELQKKELSKKRELTIFNHNPLFRLLIKTGGGLKPYYKFNIILETLIKALKENNNKYQFLFIPTNYKSIMIKNDFKKHLLTSNEKINNSSLRHKSFLFLFLLHLFSYLSNNSVFVSQYSNLSDELLRNTNLVFTNKNTFKLLNLKVALDAFNTNDKIWRLLTSIDALALEQTYDDTVKLLTDRVIVNAAKPKINKDKPDNNKPITNAKVELDFNKAIVPEIYEVIDNQPTLTPAQKDRFKEIANTYKNIPITINGKNKTIGDIINKIPKTELRTKSAIKELDKLGDPSYAESKLLNMPNDYMDKIFHHDLFKNIISLQKGGLFLTGYNEIDIKNSDNRIKQIALKFEDIKGKKSTVKFKIPLLDKDGYFVVNGIKSFMKLQLINLPITKISPIKVSLSSNYIKTVVEKTNHKRFNYEYNLRKSINKYNEDNTDKIIITNGSHDYKTKLPFEYTNLGKSISSIDTKEYFLSFDYENRHLLGKFDTLNKLEKHGILLGKQKNKKDVFLFIDNKNIVKDINIKTNEVIFESRLDNIILPEQDIIKSYDHCHLKILDKNIPIGIMLSYKYGLRAVLNHLNLNYNEYEKNERVHLRSDDMIIKFNNRKIVYKKYPLVKSWIMNGYTAFPSIKAYNIEEFENEDVYYNLFQDKGWSINYLLGISNFFMFFIDGITRDVLLQIKEPTNVRDLLIRAVDMMTTEDCRAPSDMANFRVRSLEKLNGIIYNEISRQYSRYVNSKVSNATFSINTESVFQRILQDQGVVLAEEINPIQFLKEKTSVTHSGFGGRVDTSFVERDRKYPKDGLGKISEATVDSSKVGINASLPMNPTLNNIRGLFDDKALKQLKCGNILSPTSCLLPASTNDDPKRNNFANIQMSHHVPSEKSDVAAYRTGAESIIGDLTTDLYVSRAKSEGVIEKINIKAKMFKVRYTNNNVDIFKCGTLVREASGTLVDQNIKLLVKEGDKVKADQLLAYNTGFFKYDPIFKKINWKSGIWTNVALIDAPNTIEDSNATSKSFASDLSFDASYLRSVRFGTDIKILKYLKVGDDVTFNDYLIESEYKDIAMLDNYEDDTDTKDLLQDLNRIQTKSKHNGKIIDFKLHYSGDINEFDPSLQAMIKRYISENNKKYRLAEGCEDQSEYLTNATVEAGTRIRNTVINENEVLIEYFISENTIFNASGDKLVISNQLKTISGELIDEIKTESGVDIGMMFGSTSIFARIVLSTFKIGIMEKVLEEIKNNAIKIYDS